MAKKFFDEKEFTGVDFAESTWELGDYEMCVFKDCNLSGIDLSESRFIECTFRDCDLSNCKILETAFQDCEFSGSKLLGLLFEVGSSFSFATRFRRCQLDHSSFYQVDLTRSTFVHCSMNQVDFTESNLNGSTLVSCDLSNATFDRTRLEKADLSGSYNLRIDPEINDIRGTKVSINALPGLLNKYGLQIEN